MVILGATAILNIFLLILVLFVLSSPLIGIIYVIVSTGKFSGEVWLHSGHSRALWIILSFFIPLLAPLIYGFVIRPRLVRTQTFLQHGEHNLVVMPY